MEVKEEAADVGAAVGIQLKAPTVAGVYREVLDFHFEVTDSPEIIQVPVEIFAYVMSEAS